MLTTDDLFLGGFALSRGGELVGIDVRGTHGRRVAVFSIGGPAVDDVERDYYRGTTSVDLQLLKLQVRRLKERAFQALREEESRDATDHEGRYRTAAVGEPYRRGRR
jgi:hypothetical protein